MVLCPAPVVILRPLRIGRSWGPSQAGDSIIGLFSAIEALQIIIIAKIGDCVRQRLRRSWINTCQSKERDQQRLWCLVQVDFAKLALNREVNCAVGEPPRIDRSIGT